MMLKNCDMHELPEKIKNKNLICFGAGGVLSELCCAYDDLGFFGLVKYIIDNVPEKWGTEIEYGNIKKRILSVEQCVSMFNAQELAILITCTDYYEVFKQLDSITALDKAECYIYAFVTHNPVPYEFPVRSAGDKMKIPKKIHYCWFGGGKFSQLHEMCIASWREFCPDYEIIEWNELNYDVTKNRYIREAYMAKKWAFVSDYARTDIIYEHGGIYLDVDVEVIKPLDILLYDEAFCGRQNSVLVNTGLGFGSVAKFPIIRKFRDQYTDKAFVRPDGSYDLTPCPLLETEVLSRYGLKKKNISQPVASMRIHPTDVMSPKNASTGITRLTSNSYTIHHYNGSWNAEIMARVQEKYSKSKELWDRI